jgi:hypothetical protein
VPAGVLGAMRTLTRTLRVFPAGIVSQFPRVESTVQPTCVARLAQSTNQVTGRAARTAEHCRNRTAAEQQQRSSRAAMAAQNSGTAWQSSHVATAAAQQHRNRGSARHGAVEHQACS